MAGAEASVTTLLGALGPHVEVTVMGTTASVVEGLARARPGTATRLCRPVRSKADVAAIVDHLRAVRAVRPDVFQANLHTLWSCQYGLAAAIACPGVRVVAVEHTPPIPGSPFQHRLKRWTSSRLAAHVAASRAVARAVETTAGLPAGSVRTIYNGVPESAAPLPDRRGRVIGAVGRLVPEKGFDILLAALADVPEATLRMVGDGPARAQLEAEALRLGVADRVEFRGWRDDLGAELAGMDVLAAPSRLEGTPISVVEAMLAGVAVVASRTGGLPEVVEDGETGLLAPPEDPAALAGALRSLLDDPARRARMAGKGRELALQRFSPTTAARAFEALYDEIRP
jgi:glycosyltransferase involved in cell wall biosynthesis